MLSIYATTDQHSSLQAIIQSENRLDELVSIKDILSEKPSSDAYSIFLRKGEIHFSIDWKNSQPPFILPQEIILTSEHLLGIIYAMLDNYEKAYQFLNTSNPSLFKELDFINRLKLGIQIHPDELIAHYNPFDEYRLMHNHAVVRHYGVSWRPNEWKEVEYFYKEAIACSYNTEYRAFSTKHLALFYIDMAWPEKASNTINAIIDQVSTEARIELQQVLCQAWMQQLTMPYDQDLLNNIKDTLWTVLQSFEQQDRDIEVGLLLLDATQIATISDSFAEALGYANRALDIFEQHALPELIGNAEFRKGTLLFTWTQKGNPQFFKGAIDSYQKALKVFTKESTPDVFADIHHNLGIIYTDMPAENTKKSIWAGVAVSSFQEALDFYTKENYPYQYGMICNNFANAFTKFPQAKLTDNFEKALFYYQEALDVRGTEYPMERSLTLLNYLEASWKVGNDPAHFNKSRFIEMQKKAEEVKRLTNDSEMIDQADRHIEMLAHLEQEVAG